MGFGKTQAHCGSGRVAQALVFEKGRKVTLFELEQSLPSGFHDAHVHGFSVDYVKREATITLDVLVGVPEGKTDFERETYRKALLKLSGLEYLVIDAPDSRYQYAKPGTLWIDAGPLESAKLNSKIKLPSLQSKNAFAYLFFVQDWNSFFYIAATDSSLEWLSEPFMPND